MENRKLAMIFGTRPEFIKLAPLVRACQQRDVPFLCIHTRQHHSFEMGEVFFEELNLPQPEYRLSIGTNSGAHHGERVATLLVEIEKILLKEKPRSVIVEGDTNTVLAGALAAAKISMDGVSMKVAHVEAGLRSYDRRMPEEVNRIVVDHVSEYLFAPTVTEEDILIGEGIAREKIFVTGNTIVDMVLQSYEAAKMKSTILEVLGVRCGRYVLFTLHRPENVDGEGTFSRIIEGVARIARVARCPAIFPIHPRTRSKLALFHMRLPKEVVVINPIGFLDFIALESNAMLILTDSGGVQEEACMLRVPCVTLRDSTERPETVEVGANVIAGTNPEHILVCAQKMMAAERSWPNPLGDGHAAEKIVDVLTSTIERGDHFVQDPLHGIRGMVRPSAR